MRRCALVRLVRLWCKFGADLIHRKHNYLQLEQARIYYTCLPIRPRARSLSRLWWMCITVQGRANWGSHMLDLRNVTSPQASPMRGACVVDILHSTPLHWHRLGRHVPGQALSGRTVRTSTAPERARLITPAYADLAQGAKRILLSVRMKDEGCRHVLWGAGTG